MFIGFLDPQGIDGNAIYPTSELDGLSGGEIVKGHRFLLVQQKNRKPRAG
jgi:hypothetical protein